MGVVIVICTDASFLSVNGEAWEKACVWHCKVVTDVLAKIVLGLRRCTVSADAGHTEDLWSLHQPQERGP